MYESLGSQFFRTDTVIESGPNAFDESRLVMTYLRVKGTLYSFRLVLEGKAGKVVTTSSRLEILGKRSANNFALSDAEGNTFTFFENTISNFAKRTRAKILGSDRLLCFIRISNFGCFKTSLTTITSLSEFHFRWRFIMLVQTNAIPMSNSSSTGS